MKKPISTIINRIREESYMGNPASASIGDSLNNPSNTVELLFRSINSAEWGFVESELTSCPG